MKALPFILCFLMIGCNPKVNTQKLSSSNQDRTSLHYQAFAIIEKDTVDFSGLELIGTIEIKEAGLSVNCDYETVKSLAKKEALKLGGNCLVITEHKLPSQWSTCHRIKAKVYLLENPAIYESEIEWYKERKLSISDFKGTTDKRPFTAVTFSSFRYILTTKTGFSKNYKIKATTFFDCRKSYFKRTDLDSAVLAHEQIHFDISELYARKFLMRMEAEAPTIKEALAIQEKVLDEIGTALYIKQDEYDSEVYVDPSKQTKWNDWIEQELEKTKAYADKVIFSKRKK